MEDIYYVIKGHALDAFGNLALGRPVTSLHPCYLTRHGRSYKIWPSALPDWPLSHGGNLPVDFHMHDSVPMRYRPVVRAAAAEWNRAAGFRAIAIHREIDYSDSVSQHVPDSKNLIYWLPRSDHEPSRVHVTAELDARTPYYAGAGRVGNRSSSGGRRCRGSRTGVHVWTLDGGAPRAGPNRGCRGTMMATGATALRSCAATPGGHRSSSAAARSVRLDGGAGSSRRSRPVSSTDTGTGKLSVESTTGAVAVGGWG